MSKLPSFIHSGVREIGTIVSSTPLVDAIHRGLTSLPQGWERNGRLYASDSAFCARQGVLKSRIMSTDLDTPAFHSYTKIGETMEDIVITGLHAANLLMFKQFRLFPVPGLNLGGKIDAIAFINGRVNVIEIKSCGELPKTVHERGYQAAQAAAYSAITGLPAKMLYFSRTVADFSGHLKMIDFDITKEQVRQAIWTLMYAQIAGEMGAIPNVPGHITSQAKCGFCPFKGVCFGKPENREPLPEVDSLHAVTAEENVILVERTNEFVREFMDAEAVRDRRNGVLKHIMSHNDNANRILTANDWDEVTIFE